MTIHRALLQVAAGTLAAGFASTAHATWSIVLVDTRTGEVAVASATCLTSFDLRANTPVLIPGIGGATAQSFVDSTGQNRVFIRDRLALGIAPEDILAQLATFDSGHQTRQYGIVDARGRGASFSGTGDGQWAGGQVGQFDMVYSGHIGNVAYAIQGNVLTGPPVVQRAVEAAIATGADLPGKLMAAMQAARLMGGDGRCSCNPSSPTSCGSPPPSFTKAAHISYMMIARAGDREGSNGIYRAASVPVGVAAVDLNHDGRLDLILANPAASTITISTNFTPVGAPFPMFSPVPTSYPGGQGALSLTVADLNGDQRPDLVVANQSAGIISVLRGTAAGGFGPPLPYAVGATPRAVAIADFDGSSGPDIAVASYGSSTITVFPADGGGGFGDPVVFPADTGPFGIAAADFLGSPAIDLAVIARTAAKLDLFAGNGDGTFTPGPTFDTGVLPSCLASADLDNDGDPDLVVGLETGQGVQVFLNGGGGNLSTATYAVPFQVVAVAIGDVDGDGRKDIVAAGGSSFAVLHNTGGGAFAVQRVYTVAGTVLGAALADLDNDGDLDLVLTGNGANGAVVVKNYGPAQPGIFNDGVGCATGDYFLNFNIAFQQASDPDPVLQLQTQFDQWRAQLIGRPDAVQSIVTITPPRSGPGGISTMTIALRDWQGLPITAPVASLRVEHAPGSPALASIGQVIPQGQGRYTVQLTAGPTAGLDHFRIFVDDGARPVVLMPDPALSVYTGCYANCDGSSVPPVLGIGDFMCFMDRFAAGDPYANCDGSTTEPALNVSDFICWMNQFAAGCP